LEYSLGAPMSLSEMLQWQWNGYENYHRSRTNLLIHIAAVPLFLVGNVALIVGLVGQAWVLAGGSLALMIVSMVLQGKGHGQEENPPEPFTSVGNAISRIFLEQWVTFPRFVLSGRWLAALRQAAPSR